MSQFVALMPQLVFLAGVGQLILIVASLAIPKVLRWHEEIAKLRVLMRQLFWTYAGYIWFTNLSFGLVSTLLTGSLLDRSPLAAAVTAFITVYWGVRLVIQFVFHNRGDLPKDVLSRIAEVLLTGLFLFLTLTYGLALAVNLGLMT